MVKMTPIKIVTCLGIPNVLKTGKPNSNPETLQKTQANVSQPSGVTTRLPQWM